MAVTKNAAGTPAATTENQTAETNNTPAIPQPTATAQDAPIQTGVVLADGKTGSVDKDGVVTEDAKVTASVPALHNDALKGIRDQFAAMSATPDDQMLSTDAEYLDLQLGATYDVMFTGGNVTIPNKRERQKPGGDQDATMQAECLFMDVNGLKPFINADVSVRRKVDEWKANGKFNDGKVVFCRMKIATQLAENEKTGNKFKDIEFLLKSL